MKSRRLVELMLQINKKPRFTVQELADEFGVSYRTMWRYLQELSEMGVPLYADQGAGGGYRLLKQTPVPAVRGPVSGRLVDRGAMHFAAMAFTSPYTAFAEASVLIPRLWMRLMGLAGEIPARVDPGVRWGVADNRETEFTYYVSLQVFEPGPLPEGIAAVAVPARRYAAFTHRGSMERSHISATYRQAFAWMKRVGLKQVPGALWLERYGEQYDPGAAANEFEIYIPVEQE